MPSERTVLKVFIGSPGDVIAERKVFREQIEEVNRIKANSMGYHLEALGWEDTLPGKGRPQELINEDIKESDLCVFVLWKRWGNPTVEHPKEWWQTSGFAEEFHLVDKLNELHKGVPEVFLCFKTIPAEVLADPGLQAQSVINFRERVERERRFLFTHFESDVQWEKALRGYLCEWLNRQNGNGGGIIDSRPSMGSSAATIELPVELVKKAMSALAKEAMAKADQGLITEAEVLFARATATSADPSAIVMYGNFLSRVGKYESAKEQYNRLVEIGEARGDINLVSKGFEFLGTIYGSVGDLSVAEKFLNKSLEIEKELKNGSRLSSLYNNFGNVYLLRNDNEKARDMYLKALDIDTKENDIKSIAISCGNLGVVLRNLNDLDSSEKMQRKAIEINKMLFEEDNLAVNYRNLGEIYEMKGNFSESEKYLKKSLDIHKKLGNQDGMAGSYSSLGILYTRKNDTKEAEKMHRKALTIYKGVGNIDSAAAQHANLGGLYSSQGEIRMALSEMNKALQLYIETENTQMTKRIKQWIDELNR